MQWFVHNHTDSFPFISLHFPRSHMLPPVQQNVLCLPGATYSRFMLLWGSRSHTNSFMFVCLRAYCISKTFIRPASFLPSAAFGNAIKIAWELYLVWGISLRPSQPWRSREWAAWMCALGTGEWGRWGWWDKWMWGYRWVKPAYCRVRRSSAAQKIESSSSRSGRRYKLS